MDFRKLPHDGHVIIKITGKNNINRLNEAYENVNDQREELYKRIIVEAKRIGLKEVIKWNGRNNLIYDFCGAIRVPKKLIGSYNRDEWRIKQTINVNEKIESINLSFKGNNKAYKIDCVYDILNEGTQYLAFKIDIMSCSPLKDLVVKIETVQEVLNDILKELPDNMFGSAGGRTVIRRQYPELHNGVWFGFIPISEKEEQPEYMKLPVGVKRITYSQYWSTREKLCLKKN